MMPSGPPNPMGPGQPAASLLRTSSSSLSGGQQGMGGGGGMLASQSPFSSLVSPRTQFGMLGGAGNASALLNRASFGNGGPMPGSGSMPGGGMPMSTLQQRGGLDSSGDFGGVGGADPLSFPSSSQVSMSSQMGSDNLQSTSQQLDSMQDLQKQQQQLPMSYNQQQLPPQPPQQLQQPQATVKMENGGSMVGVKVEQQMGQSDQNGPAQMMRNAGGVKLEPQQLEAHQMMRSLSAVKMEQPNSDSSSFLEQQQHQQLLQLAQQIRNSPDLVSMGGPNAIAHPQAAASAQLSLLQQQRLMHMQQQQQQQQQQILKNLPLQRNQLQQQQQQQQQLLRQQSLNMRTPGKSAPYEPGTCAKRLTHYMYHQQNRPQDNNIEFWRNFFNEYFAPNAKKRWCVSLYGSGRQTTGVFPQDVWHCEICNRKPGRGFETTVEVLPRLCQIKYASGTQEELLYIDMPHESQNASGQIILDYTNAIQESIFDQLRVVREGHLRVVFNQDLKIASWEFCARRHDELIPRRSIIPQVSNLGSVVQKYQTAVQNSASLSNQDMQNNCNAFVASSRQLAKALEVPLVNDLGYTKRYVRCLQIAEVVNCMKDLIDHSRQTGSGPIDSLRNFPRRTPSGVNPLHPQQQQPEQQQPIPQSSNQSGQSSGPMTAVQASASANGDTTSHNSLNCAPSTSAPSPSVAGLLQNSMNSRQDHPMNNTNGSPYNGGGNAAIPKVTSTSSLQLNPSTSFPSPIPTSSNQNMMPAPQNMNQLSSPTTSPSIPPMQPPATRLQELEPSESQSSVQRILQDLIMSSPMNGVGQSGSDVKRPNGLTPGVDGVYCLAGNAITNNSGMVGMGFGAMGRPGHGMRAAMANNAMAVGGRIGMNHNAHDLSQLGQLHQQQQQQQQHDIGNQLLGGLRSVNSFDNIQYDWKPSQ